MNPIWKAWGPRRHTALDLTLFSRRKGGNGKLIDQSITKITRAYSFQLEAATVTIVLSMIMHGYILACVFGGLLVHFRALRGKGARAKHVVAIVVVLVTSRIRRLYLHQMAEKASLMQARSTLVVNTFSLWLVITLSVKRNYQQSFGDIF